MTKFELSKAIVEIVAEYIAEIVPNYEGLGAEEAASLANDIYMLLIREQVESETMIEILEAELARLKKHVNIGKGIE